MDTHPIRQGNRTPNKETNPVVYIYENRGVTGEIVDNGRWSTGVKYDNQIRINTMH